MVQSPTIAAANGRTRTRLGRSATETRMRMPVFAIVIGLALAAAIILTIAVPPAEASHDSLCQEMSWSEAACSSYHCTELNMQEYCAPTPIECPPGQVPDGESCITPNPPPPPPAPAPSPPAAPLVDVCSNLEGIQTSPPDGYNVDVDLDLCVQPAPVVAEDIEPPLPPGDEDEAVAGETADPAPVAASGSRGSGNLPYTGDAMDWLAMVGAAFVLYGFLLVLVGGFARRGRPVDPVS
jgi:hypothetical protein